MQISEEIIQKIKEQNDIVDIISETVKLKRTGRNFSGLCPFHNEKSPSFFVSQEKQIYKCFGCGEGGDVINFVMKMENLDFMEAVKLLAEKNGIEFKTNISEADKKKMESIKLMHKEQKVRKLFSPIPLLQNRNKALSLQSVNLNA
mgnify:CR=1 FL=1